MSTLFRFAIGVMPGFVSPFQIHASVTTVYPSTVFATVRRQKNTSKGVNWETRRETRHQLFSSSSHLCTVKIPSAKVSGNSCGILCPHCTTRCSCLCCKHLAMTCRATRLQRIFRTIKRDSRHCDLRFRCKSGLEIAQRRVTLSQPKAKAIRVSDHLHKVLVREGRSRSGEHRRFRNPNLETTAATTSC